MIATPLSAELRHRVHEGLALDLRLELGNECGVLFGASGTGKTTILRMIAGLSRPDTGQVRLGEKYLCDTGRRLHLPIRSRRIGMIFQDDLLFPHLSVAGNVRFGLRGYPRTEVRARLSEVAALCEVEHLLDRRPLSLSGGERQRVGLARALAPRPRLLLCDEPVSALDLEARDGLLERLRTARRAEGVPMLYVTHAPAEAVAMGDRLFLLAEGRIVDQGRPLEVLARRGPRSELPDLRNVFPATVASHDADTTRLQLDGGPTLFVPRGTQLPDTRALVMIRADDILLARGEPGTWSVSAHNVIPGVIQEVIPHGSQAEVIVRTGGVCWIVGVVASALTALSLQPGVACFMIVKARSCHLLAPD